MWGAASSQVWPDERLATPGASQRGEPSTGLNLSDAAQSTLFLVGGARVRGQRVESPCQTLSDVAQVGRRIRSRSLAGGGGHSAHLLRSGLFPGQLAAY